MRIVIDLQGAQTISRFRGIGRYSMALAQAIARNAGDHEIWLVLNAALAESLASIRSAFAGLIPKQRIRVFEVPAPVAQNESENAWRARSAEKIREHFIQELHPDMVLVTSLFEGYLDDGVTSVGAFCSGTHTAVILYDLIPLLNPDTYLPTQLQKQYYERKIRSLGNAGLLLSISNYSRQEAIDALQLEPGKVVCISSAVEPHFKPAKLAPDEAEVLYRRFGISRRMVLCAPGGFDARKNIEGLIQAYGLLPADLRANHQLVLASRLTEAEQQHLYELAQESHLAPDELVITGYVTNADLVALYSMATLFVYPSKHEGFGLPALEAMACGAPVIGSNCTSVPEVIDFPVALFDPFSAQAIADKLLEVLTNRDMLNRLREHGLIQAAKFSWDVSAQRALRAMEAYVAAAKKQAVVPVPIKDNKRKLRLAFVSPLPPEKTGIANYSLELLPALAEHYEIELVCDQAQIALPPSLSSLTQRTAGWFAANGDCYDRIIYQFGNSPFHSHMLALLRQHPGVVTLHDFFLSGLLAYEEVSGNTPGAWTQALFHSHGYAAVLARCNNDQDDVKNTYPCNLEILQNALGIIVHSPYSQALARQWYGEYGAHAADNWTVIPHLRNAVDRIDRRAARKALGISEETFVVCSFGFIAPTKLTDRLLDAWLSSRLARERNCMLILVGENHGGSYGVRLSDRIRKSGCRNRIRITGWTDEEVYNHYLQAADLGIQLRTLSRGETSGAVLHCLNYGVATIVNANGSMADLPDEVVKKLPDAFADAELTSALDLLWSDHGKRRALGSAAAAYIKAQHSPRQCAGQYAMAIERSYAEATTDQHALLQSIAEIPELPTGAADLQALAQTIARATTEKFQMRQLLVDVSAISRSDLRTGIERVVRAQLLALLQNPPPGFRVEPVYLSSAEGIWHYRYARGYAKKLLALKGVALEETAVEIGTNDIFYSPDFYPGAVLEAAQSELYQRWRRLGIEVNFMVFDLLPVLRPEFFPEQADQLHARWLDCVADNADRLICISNSVAAELAQWLKQRGHDTPVKIVGIPLGADINASKPSTGVPADANLVLSRIGTAPSFLMVGTIEPRKGHLQTLAAFEQLWQAGSQLKLVIVGKEGWTPLATEQRRSIPEIVDRLRHHPELGKRLFWLQDVSDEYLERVYKACTCLIFASEGEGFGLPLIEAAQHKLPIIARDMPVCREVAQQHAHYFTGLAAESLATAISDWLKLDKNGRAPSSTAMSWLTWTKNVEMLVTELTDDNKLT